MNVNRHVGACLAPFQPRRTRQTRAVLVCCLVLTLAGPAAASDQINWRTDYAAALKEAAEKGVPLMLSISSENCFWCKQLDARTFVDEEIVRLLNKRCIPLKVDGGKNLPLVQALKVQSYPTLIFASHDGNILGFREGFLEPAALKEQIGKVLAAVGTPDWMQRDYEAASKAIGSKDLPRAITLLRGIVEDGKSRPIQLKARTYLADLEKQASEQVAKAGELAEKGKTGEAIAEYGRIGKLYPGTLAARKSQQFAGELVSRSKAGESERKRQAEEMLKLAREDFKSRQYLCCLDRTEILLSRYRDLPEAEEAEKLAAEIKDNPEWTKTAAEQMGDRLCVLYLSLADTMLRKGQPQQAVYYLERVVKMFPTSKHAETAQGKLARVRGGPPERK